MIKLSYHPIFKVVGFVDPGILLRFQPLSRAYFLENKTEANVNKCLSHNKYH